MGQYAVRYSESAIDLEGNAIVNAAFTVYLAGTTTVAQTYTGEDKTLYVGPHTTDNRGYVTFWTDPGTYDVKIGDNAVIQLSTLTPDDRDQLDTSALGVTVARLNPDTHLLDETQLATNIRNAYTKPSSGIPKTDLSSIVISSLNKADSAIQIAPVTSVNGQTGAVVIDVGSGGGGQTIGDATATEKGLIQLPGGTDGSLQGPASNPSVVGFSTRATIQQLTDGLSGKVGVSDPRLTDARNPLSNSVDNSHVKTNAAIAISKISGLQALLDSKYQLQPGGIASTDMTQSVQDALALALAAVQLGNNGKIAGSLLPGPNMRSTSTNTSVAYGDFLEVDASGGARTITTPTPTAGSLPFDVCKTDDSDNTVTISGTINGQSGLVLTVQDQTVTLVAKSDNSGFRIR